MITEKNYRYYYQSMKHWLDQKDTIQTEIPILTKMVIERPNLLI